MTRPFMISTLQVERIEDTLASLSFECDRTIPEWSKSAINNSRRGFRRAVMVKQGGFISPNPVSHFGKPDAFEYHELINRFRTPEFSIARWLSYQPELCAVLTREEHEKAHNRHIRDQLFQINYRKYGYEDVKAVYDLLNSFLRIPVGIQLPEPETQ